MRFSNLYVQTEYSLLNSAISLDSLFKYAIDNHLDYLAIADNDMYGAYKFYQGCIKNNIKPVIGLCLNLNDKKEIKDNILLYATNLEGYINLCKLASIKQTSGFKEDKYYVLSKYSKGLVAILPGIESSVISNYDLASDNKELVDNLIFLRGVFEHLYVGMMVQSSIDKDIFSSLYVLCRANNIKMVALNKTYYLDKNDIELYKIIKLISLISSDTKNYELTEREYNGAYLNDDNANYIFANYPDLIENTFEICSLCNLELPKQGYHFPKFKLNGEDNLDANSYLEELAKVGLNKRLASKKVDRGLVDVYKNRLLYELDIIKKMGFSDYFLIVYDYVRFAKLNNILVGPGRGSAAGSLVSYALGIINVDPIEYDLLFERFLNPERISMPDIDVDFPDDARDKVYHYLKDKYGEYNVAHIGTFGTFKPRSAIRDVAKVMGIKDSLVSIINGYIPVYNSPSLDSISKGVVDIKKMIEGNNTIRDLFYYASRIENMPRNVSTHASGIVISDNDLTNYTPLAKGLNGIYQTEYEASDLENIGLVKMDILSLSNLNTIDKIINEIKIKKGIEIDVNKLKYDDKEVFKLMASGDTDGIFQFESAGMRKVLRDMKVSSLDDMIIANAIYRPGPQEMIPLLIERKNGKPYKGLDPSIDDILKPTYGIIVFQEQVMMIAKNYSGFTLGQADLLRRAISKKKVEEMASLRKMFLDGAIKNNHSEVEANKIYDYIVKFGDYGFNKSHAAVYSMVAYQMAYLKTYYYPFFMAYLMESSLNDKDKLGKYIASIKARRYILETPNINLSSNHFEVDGNILYYPLQGIKDISAGVAADIINERKNGLFINYEDFVIRTKSILNKKMVTSLIGSGAIDALNISRKSAIEAYDNIISKSLFTSKSMEGKLVDSIYDSKEYDLQTISSMEREYLGFNIKYDEFIKYKEVIRRYNTKKLIDVSLGKNIVLAKLDYINEYNSKSGLMAFIRISDSSANHDVTVFSSDYLKFKGMLSLGEVYLFEIMVNKKGEETRFHLTNLHKL